MTRRLAIVICYGVIFVIDNTVTGRATLSSRSGAFALDDLKGDDQRLGSGSATIPDVVDGA